MSVMLLSITLSTMISKTGIAMITKFLEIIQNIDVKCRMESLNRVLSCSQSSWYRAGRSRPPT